MEITELVASMRWQLLLDRARYNSMRCTASNVLRHDVLGIVLSYVLPLLIPQPARFDELDPTIVTENSRNERLHGIVNLKACLHVFLDLPQKCIVLIYLHSELSAIIVFGVHWPVL